ncbi:MAG: hypothetical protein HQ568_01045 [Calditrichaeota bacterium]|nr:hypothetical protein [Calditrichota bacterium]
MKEDIKNINNDDTKLFPSVVSQTEIKQHFNRILDGTRMAHAFLFIGQEGTGRLAMALEIARVMNCESSSQTDTRKGCNCNSCRNILSPGSIPISIRFFRFLRLTKIKVRMHNWFFVRLFLLKQQIYMLP